jgi:hypothetical protein
MKARALQFLDKAKSALVSAIEIYNKPDFKYREEAFCILALNAWELLLKARILEVNNNDPRSIFVYEQRRTKAGDLSTKEYIKRNRAGNPYTMGLGQIVVKLDKDLTSKLSPAVKANLDGLIEIRDNAIHFINPGSRLAKRTLEIGTASVRNFIDLAQRWFNEDLSDYSLYLMPIGFVPATGVAEAIAATSDEAKLLKYLEDLISHTDMENSEGYSVALEVDISMKRSSGDAAIQVALSDDPDAVKVQLTEEDIRKKYPWDYARLSEQLRKRYVDFKMNKKYHSIRKPLRGDPMYVKTRLLDPGNPKSSRKDFYNPNIIREFDRHYTRKK